MEPSAVPRLACYASRRLRDQVRQGRRLRLDGLVLGEAVEPGRWDRRSAVERSKQRAGHRRVRVGVAAEADHVPEAVLEAELLTGDLQGDAGREQAEALIRAVDLTGPSSL